MRATYHSLMNTIILNNHVNLKLGVGGGGGRKVALFSFNFEKGVFI